MARRFLLRPCAAVVVPSKTLFNLAINVWHLPPQKVIYLPNGIDHRRFEREPDSSLIQQYRLSPDQAVVGTVAALRPEKNLLRLLRVFAQLPASLNPKLVIVGEGPDRARIEASARTLNISDRLVLTGALAEPERLLKRFDVFALTSDTEQMPNSVLEAMAAERVIVSTDVGDVKQMVASENRPFVIDLADETGLKDAIRRPSFGCPATPRNWRPQLCRSGTTL